MNKATLLTLPCLLSALLTPALSRGEEFLLYTPKPAEEGQAPASPNDGVLVRKITIKSGDTLSDLSRKYSGRSSYFPQMLIFNSIKNPDLIITGDQLLVPVSPEHAAATEGKVVAEKKHAKRRKGQGAGRKAHRKHAGAPEAATTEKAKPAVVRPAVPQPEALPPGKTKIVKPALAKPESVKPAEKSPPRPVSTEESGHYRQAKLAYLNGEYQKALMLFTEFLDKYPSSSFAADAALYRADSMLHLSGE